MSSDKTPEPVYEHRLVTSMMPPAAIYRIIDEAVVQERIGVWGSFSFHRALHSLDPQRQAARLKDSGPLHVAVFEGYVEAILHSRLAWTDDDHRGKGLCTELLIARALDIGYQIVLIDNKPAVVVNRPARQELTPGGRRLLQRGYELMVQRGLIEHG